LSTGNDLDAAASHVANLQNGPAENFTLHVEVPRVQHGRTIARVDEGDVLAGKCRQTLRISDGSQQPSREWIAEPVLRRNAIFGNDEWRAHAETRGFTEPTVGM
jgi:hypothetical protein